MSEKTCDYFLDTPPDRHGTNSIKWDRQCRGYGCSDLTPLAIADMDFPVAPEIRAALERRAAHPVYGYACMGPGYISAVTGWYQRRHGWAVQPQWVVPSCAVVTALGFSIDALTQPGDGVIVFTPVYNPFYIIVEGSGRRLVECPLLLEEGRYAIDYQCVEAAMKAGAKVLLLCNPHNPVGRVWRREELERLAALCVRYDVTILSDEVHGDITFDGHRYTPMAALDDARERTAVFTAPSKTFNVAGVSTSNLIVPNEGLRKKIQDSLMTKFIMGTNLFGYVLCEAAYTHGEAWLDAILAYLDRNRRAVTGTLRQKAPGIGVTELEGSYLMWLDMRCFGLGGKELCRLLAEECGVLVNDGTEYRAPEGFVRINIACCGQVISRFLDRLVQFYARHTQQKQ